MRILTPHLMRPSGKRFAMLIAGKTIYANEEHATTQPHSLNLWNACQCLACLNARSEPMRSSWTGIGLRSCVVATCRVVAFPDK